MSKGIIHENSCFPQRGYRSRLVRAEIWERCCVMPRRCHHRKSPPGCLPVPLAVNDILILYRRESLACCYCCCCFFLLSPPSVSRTGRSDEISTRCSLYFNAKDGDCTFSFTSSKHMIGLLLQLPDFWQLPSTLQITTHIQGWTAESPFHYTRAVGK